MIFPDVSVENWCKKHNLEVRQCVCPNCGYRQTIDIPFITKECVGLVAPLHDCGEQYQASFASPRCAKVRQRWQALVFDFNFKP
jgi:hypothetical protein